MANLILLVGEQPPPATITHTIEQAGFQLRGIPTAETGEIPSARAVVLDVAAEQLAAWVKRVRGHTPLILALVPNTPHARQTALAAGVDDLLTAPLDAVELLHRSRHETKVALGDVDILGHDLKSPIGTVIASLELLRELLPEESIEFSGVLSDALRTAYRQNTLIENMIDFLRIYYGDYSLDMIWLPVRDIVTRFREHAHAEIARKSIQPLQFDIPDELPEVYTDPILIEQVMLALLENALKFCTRSSQIKLRVEHSAPWVLLHLIDNGRPILPPFAGQIFEQSQQLHARMEGSRTSVGLNLPFARAALRLMGGDISAHTKDSWTTFTLHLPCSKP